jgi:hypothetical protein
MLIGLALRANQSRKSTRFPNAGEAVDMNGFRTLKYFSE